MGAPLALGAAGIGALGAGAADAGAGALSGVSRNAIAALAPKLAAGAEAPSSALAAAGEIPTTSLNGASKLAGALKGAGKYAGATALGGVIPSVVSEAAKGLGLPEGMAQSLADALRYKLLGMTGHK